MNVLLQALEREGYVTRPADAPVGKAVRMLAGTSETERADAFRLLPSTIGSLRGGDRA